MTPRQARAARAILGLSLKEACQQAGIGKRTLTEFEAGTRSINTVTVAKLWSFYIGRGLSFSDRGDDGVRIAADANASEPASTQRPMTESLAVLNPAAAITLHESLREVLKSLTSEAMVSRAMIVYLTKHKGLQGAQIAERLGVTKSFVSAVLTGKKMLAIKHADRLDQMFGGRFDALAALRLERALKKQLTLISGAEHQMMEAWQSLQH